MLKKNCIIKKSSLHPLMVTGAFKLPCQARFIDKPCCGTPTVERAGAEKGLAAQIHIRP